MCRRFSAWKLLAILDACFFTASYGITPSFAAPSARDGFARTEFGVSQDGTRLAYPVPAYDGFGDPLTEIWVSGVDGSGRRRVGSVPGEWSVRWRNAHELVAYQYDQIQFYIIPVVGGKPGAVPLTDNFRWIKPAISPDGNHVAFNAVRKSPESFGVFLQDIPSHGVRTLNADIVRSFLDWSPDSSKIVYGAGDYQRAYRLKIVNIATGATLDTGVEGTGARWSPDGKWIAYTGDIVRGGSWRSGVPMDGRILKMNTETRATVALTEPAVNQVDSKTGKREWSGAIWPVWSPDGGKIAYHRVHQVISKPGETPIAEDEIWVMNADGTARRKVLDRETPFAWANDGTTLFIKGESGISRVALDTGVRRTVVTWNTPEPPKLADTDYKSLVAPGARVKYARIDPKYARAILAVAAAARNVYASELNCDMPAEVIVTAMKDPEARANLWNDGESHMFLTVRSMNDLAAPQQSGVFNIYGICHEMGHLAMYRRCRPLGLPDGIAEGWAHYAGSVVTDRVYVKLGSRVWPVPYDFGADGTPRLRQQAAAQGDPTAKAASAFYRVHQQFGPQKVFHALNRAMDGKPYGKDVMPRFVDALVQDTKDPSARTLFPHELITPIVRWETSERKITDRTVVGLEAVKDINGVLLRYDTGKSAGMRSTAGAGHAVAFKLPAGNWAIDAIEMYGSRYGEPTPPRENFSIFLCDEDFNVEREIEEPYSMLTYGGKPSWNRFSFAPVKAPQVFYLCVFFNPTADRGFYMHYESGHKVNHSRAALPWTFVKDVDYDWMLRVHIRPQ